MLKSLFHNAHLTHFEQYLLQNKLSNAKTEYDAYGVECPREYISCAYKYRSWNIVEYILSKGVMCSFEMMYKILWNVPFENFTKIADIVVYNYCKPQIGNILLYIAIVNLFPANEISKILNRYTFDWKYIGFSPETFEYNTKLEFKTQDIDIFHYLSNNEFACRRYLPYLLKISYNQKIAFYSDILESCTTIEMKRKYNEISDESIKRKKTFLKKILY